MGVISLRYGASAMALVFNLYKRSV